MDPDSVRALASQHRTAASRDPLAIANAAPTVQSCAEPSLHGKRGSTRWFPDVDGSQAPVLVHAEDTGIQAVYVYDHNGSRYMTFAPLGTDALLIQSEMALAADRATPTDYRQALVALVATHPRVDSVLVIGVGGGTLPTALQRIFPQCRIDAVDYDPGVIRIAQALFGLSNRQVRLHAVDGRAFVKQALAAGTTYDAIVIDAFDKDYIPERLMTLEFLNELKGILAPTGLIAINSFGGGPLRDRSCATHAAAFGGFLELMVDTNRIIVAHPRGAAPDGDVAAHAAPSQSDLLRLVGVDHGWVAQQSRSPRPWDPDARPVRDSEAGSDELRRLREGARFNC